MFVELDAVLDIIAKYRDKHIRYRENADSQNAYSANTTAILTLEDVRSDIIKASKAGDCSK